MQQTALFVEHAGYYFVGDPASPAPWIGANPDALAALHRIVSMPGAWCDVQAFGGSRAADATHHRLRNAAAGLTLVSPLLAEELRRGLKRKRSIDGRTLWRYDPHGATAFIETRPK